MIRLDHDHNQWILSPNNEPMKMTKMAEIRTPSLPSNSFPEEQASDGDGDKDDAAALRLDMIAQR